MAQCCRDRTQRVDRRIGSTEELREEVAAWQARRDQIRAKVNWQFTTENALPHCSFPLAGGRDWRCSCFYEHTAST
jgi:hypothetical protein